VQIEVNIVRGVTQSKVEIELSLGNGLLHTTKLTISEANEIIWQLSKAVVEAQK
jgi:hypothetical protein